MATQKQRDFLIYAPCNNGAIAADLWADDRNFDIALNNYAGTTPPPLSDYSYAIRGHKWPCISSLIAQFERYYAVCFLDDDIEVDAARMNRLFVSGMEAGKMLWQAALTKDSYGNHKHLFQQRNADEFRSVPLVEIMMPVFCREAFFICRPSFSMSESGYGLDYLWPKMLGNSGLAVMDSVAVRHPRKISSNQWKLSNGKTPDQELRDIKRKHRLHRWRYLPYRPHGI